MTKQIAWLLLAACLCAAGAAWADTGTPHASDCLCKNKSGCTSCEVSCVCTPATVETVEIERITTHPDYAYTAFTLPRSMTVYSSASGQGIERVLPAGAEVDIGTPVLGRNPILYQGRTRAGYIDLDGDGATPFTASGNGTTVINLPLNGMRYEDGLWYCYVNGVLLFTRDNMGMIVFSGLPDRKQYYLPDVVNAQQNHTLTLILTPGGYWVDETGKWVE